MYNWAKRYDRVGISAHLRTLGLAIAKTNVIGGIIFGQSEEIFLSSGSVWLICVTRCGVTLF